MSRYNLKTMSDEEFDRQYDEAIERGIREDADLPKAVSAKYNARTKRIVIEMDSGVTFLVPVDLIQGLQTDDVETLSDLQLMARGTQIHWDTLDVQFYIGSLFDGSFGSTKWMAGLKEHLAEIGRKGGSAKTPVKRAASAENGKKGGRPRKTRTA